MQNKKLEQRLKKEGHLEWINLISMCEEDPRIKELRVDKKVGLPKSIVTAKMVETYLSKINVRIKLIDAKKEVEKLKNIEEKTKKVSACKNAVHLPFKKKIDKETKKEIYKSYKFPLISVDEKVFVICPECNSIIEIKDE